MLRFRLRREFVKRRFSISNIVFLSISGVLFYILNQSKNEMWDGVIPLYSHESGNFRLLREYMFSDGWHLQYFLFRAEYFVSGFTGLQPRSLNFGIEIIALFTLMINTRWILKNLFGVSRRYSSIAGAYFGFLPIWSILYSSIHNIHIISFALCLLGIRLINSNRINFSLFGFLSILISFQLNSLLVLAPSIQFIIDTNFLRTFKIHKCLKSLYLALMAGIYFLLHNLIFHTYGYYRDYNKIHLPQNNLELLQLYKGFLNFYTWLFSTTILIFILGIFSITQRKLGPQNKLIKSSYQIIISLVFLSVSATIPYLAVGKCTSILDFKDWGYRQGIGIAFISAISVGMLLNQIDLFNSSFFTSKRMDIVVSIFFIILLVISNLSFTEKASSNSFRQGLTSIIKNQNIPKTANVIILVPFEPQPVLRSYEMQYLLWVAKKTNRGNIIISSDFRMVKNFDFDKFNLEGTNLWGENTGTNTLLMKIDSKSIFRNPIANLFISNCPSSYQLKLIGMQHLNSRS